MDIVITYHDYRDAGCVRTRVATDVTPELAEFYQGLGGRHPDGLVPLRNARQRWESGRYDVQRDWLLIVDGIKAVDIEYTETERDTRSVSVPPVDRLEVTRYGARVRGTWLWPEDVTLAEVTVIGTDGPTTTQITRSDYLRNGHCVWFTQSGGGRLVVTSLRATPTGVHRAIGDMAAFEAEPLTLRTRCGGIGVCRCLAATSSPSRRTGPVRVYGCRPASVFRRGPTSTRSWPPRRTSSRVRTGRST